MKTFVRLLHYLGKYWKDTILTWFFVLVESVCEVLAVFFMRDLLNSVQSMDVNGIYLYAGIITGMAVFAAAMGILAGIFSASAAGGFGKNLREEMFRKIQTYSFKNIDKFSTSSIVTRTTTDVTNVQNGFLQAIRAVIRAPFLMVFSLIMCFVIEPKLAWIFLAIIPICLFVLLFLAKKVHPSFVEVFETYDKLNQSVEEDVDGIRTVKAFNQEKKVISQFKGVSGYIYKNFVHAEKTMAFNQPLVNLGVYGAMVVIAYFGSLLIVRSGGTDLTIGGLNTLITFIMMIMMSMVMISMVYVMLIISKNSAERIEEILLEEPDIVNKENPILDIADGSVVFSHVDFSYHEGKTVLFDLDFKIPSGSMVGIIGSTGSGKSSLINLIARLYDVDKGEVEVGGVDVRNYDVTSLRDNVAVVLQKNTLFSGTILDNLRWGKQDASDEEIQRACDVAQVTPFVAKLPNGLNTVLAEGGTNVSGGQKQRICIARALLKNPKILILDDSTSACDTHTDSLIRKALSTGRPDITKFVISQRVLSIKDCDLILVMNEGKIVSKGTNEELLSSCQVYKELYQSQLGGGDFDAAN